MRSTQTAVRIRTVRAGRTAVSGGTQTKGNGGGRRGEGRRAMTAILPRSERKATILDPLQVVEMEAALVPFCPVESYCPQDCLPFCTICSDLLLIQQPNQRRFPNEKANHVRPTH
jgi:hypothetical protein